MHKQTNKIKNNKINIKILNIVLSLNAVIYGLIELSVCIDVSEILF